MANNFLVPNGTFIAELIAFLLILFVMGRYVVPPVQKAMRERQAMVQKQIDDSQHAAERLAAAEARYRDALNEARTEAAKIRDSARADAQRISEEMQDRAHQEVARIQQRGEEQLRTARAQAARELQSEVGRLAVTLAERIVGDSLSDDSRRDATVDRLLDELESMAERSSAPTASSGSR